MYDVLRPQARALGGKVLGATDPTQAAAGSLRRQILERWRELGLKAEPNVGDNGVHASASPFEGLAERMNWIGAKPALLPSPNPLWCTF